MDTKIKNMIKNKSNKIKSAGNARGLINHKEFRSTSNCDQWLQEIVENLEFNL